MVEQQSVKIGMESDVFAAVAKQFKVSAATITAQTRFDTDLAADSLSLIELLFAIQQRTGIKIPEEQPAEFVTVGELVEFMNALSSRSEAQ